MPTPGDEIVVPLDGSKESERAIPDAVLLAHLYKTGVAFVHVEASAAKSAAEREHRDAIFRDYVRDHLTQTALRSPQWNATTLEGSPASAILTFAEGARFIVLASHGRGGFRASVVGSVADKIVRASHLPVLVVPAHAPEFPLHSKPVLVALDGSNEAKVGLTIARDLAARCGSRLVLLRAYNWMPPVQAEFVAPPDELADGLREDATTYLSKIAHPGEQQIVVSGRPEDAIVETAEAVDAALAVMTTHGLGLARRIALGSTTDRVLHRIGRPLLIIPAP